MSDTSAQRTEDRRLDELTDELRVMIPGATVLFAFLLTLPFATGFAGSSAPVRWLFLVGFLTAGAALVLFIGGSAYHRLRGHPYDKGLLVVTDAAGGGRPCAACDLPDRGHRDGGRRGVRRLMGERGRGRRRGARRGDLVRAAAAAPEAGQVTGVCLSAWVTRPP